MSDTPEYFVPFPKGFENSENDLLVMIADLEKMAEPNKVMI